MNNNNLERKKYHFLNLSIEKRLPILISLLLIIVIIAISTTSYLGIRRASLQVGKERLKALTTQFSALFRGSEEKIEQSTLNIAANKLVQNFINNPQSKNDSAALFNSGILSFPADSLTLAVEMYNKDKKLIYTTYPSVSEFSRLDSSEFGISSPVSQFITTGKFRIMKDSIIYPVTATVLNYNKKPEGFLVRWRFVRSNKGSIEQIRSLLGRNATIYIGNADNSVWTDFRNKVTGPPQPVPALNPVEYSSTMNNPVLAQKGIVQGTPWAFLIELPKDTILEASNRFLQWMIVIGLLILLIGFFLAWIMSRNITRPLNSLSISAQKISHGNYNTEVNLNRDDELGNLASSFNTMVAKVRNSQNELENKVRERTSQLRAANIELEELNYKLKELDEVKTNFFTNISHELRTPLTLILGPLEKLLNNGTLSKENTKDLKIVRQNAGILLKQVNNLLDLSKLEVGKLKVDYSNIDIVSLIRLIASHFEVMANERKINYEINVPEKLLVEADQEKIERIFMNLLSNAFKFTPENGSIIISANNKEGYANFKIGDSGPGIEPELMETIFDRFRQGQGGSNANIGGTGLGLAIVKEFIQLHGGKISVHNNSMGGAEFDFSIPLKAPSGTEIKSVRSFPAQQTLDLIPENATNLISDTLEVENNNQVKPHFTSKKKASVLVVEDNISMNNFISEILSDNYIILSAYNGQEGYDKALKYKPDLILSDIMMPLMSGDEMIKKIKQNPSLEDIPVILLTAKADEKLKVNLLSKGIQDYLSKPFTIDELKVRIENTIRIKLSREKLQKELSKYNDDISILAEEIIEKKQLLETSLAEKDILLKELHHRVKNNLQIIASLLNLQSESVKDPKSLESFRESQNRIQSMALIHEKLYKSEGFAKVNLRDYVDDLIKYLTGSYKLNHTKVKINVEINNIIVHIDAAISLGLILSEIITNSFKYAFSEGESGFINIKFEYLNGSGCKLIVSDDGKGFPEDFDIEKKETLGIMIIKTLVDQMNGKIRVTSHPGTEIEIEFPPTIPVESVISNPVKV